MSEIKTNFWDKRNTNGFDKRPGDINLKGRPKNKIREELEILDKAWYTYTTINDIIKIMTYLLDKTEKELKEIAADKNMPTIIRNSAEALLKDKRLDILNKTLDRVYWSATQNIKQDINTHDIVILKPQNNFKNKKDEGKK